MDGESAVLVLYGKGARERIQSPTIPTQTGLISAMADVRLLCYPSQTKYCIHNTDYIVVCPLRVISITVRMIRIHIFLCIFSGVCT